MKATRFLLALPVLCTAVWAAPADGLVLPEQVFPQLQGILETAVKQSPRMINRALDLEVAENLRISGRSGLLPSVGGYASYYEAQDKRADIAGRLDVTKIAYNFSITQPIFHWGERRNAARISEIQQKITQGQYREGYRLLAQEVRASYLRLIVQKTALKRAKFNAELAVNQLKLQEERSQRKVISGAEVVLARTNAELAQLSVERMEFDYENAKSSLSRLSGTPFLADDAIPTTIPEMAYTAPAYDSLLAGFLGQKDPATTEAATLRRNLEIEDLNYANLKTRLRPKLSAVVGVSQDEQSYTLNTAQKYRVNSIYGGVSVSWAIFDGFATGAAQRNSFIRRRQLENDYRQLTERLALDAQNQVKLINFSARNMSIYDRYLTSGKGGLESAQQEFKRGTKSEADVNAAQLALYDAEINAYNTRIDFLTKNGDFLGMLMEDPVLANVADAK